MASRANPVLTPPDGLRITKLTKTPEGFHTANVHLGDEHATVDDRFGSWQAVKNGSGNGDTIRQDVRPTVAAALQGALATDERRTR